MRFQRHYTDQYVSGLWSDELFHALAWYGGKFDSDLRLAHPSWSWLSVAGFVTFQASRRLATATAKAIFEVVARDSADDWSPGRRPCLRVTGYLWKGRINQANSTSPSTKISLFERTSLPIMEPFLDSGRYTSSAQANVPCLLLCTTKRPDVAHFLVLSEVRADDSYWARRIERPSNADDAPILHLRRIGFGERYCVAEGFPADDLDVAQRTVVLI